MMGKPFGSRQRGGRCCRKRVQLRFEVMEPRFLLANFSVTITDDSGPGSLRQAILDANAATEPAAIDFQIGSGGPETIYPLSALPEITNSVTIDGTSQPGYPGFPLITINGSLAGSGVDGLTIAGGNSTVRGMDLVAFSGSGIVLKTNGGDVIDSSIVGTDFEGHTGLGNSVSGVLIDDVSGNVIGTSLATGNVLSGNDGGAGLAIFGSGASNNLVQDNFIGTDASGSKAVGNGTGVAIIGAPGNVIGGTSLATANLLSGNKNSGLVISGSGATGNLVQDNFIGTDASGSKAVGNGTGVAIIGAPGNVIGTSLATGNLLSGNNGPAVSISGSGATGNLVGGNFIGTDTTGTAPLANLVGVFISGASNNTIGGTEDGARNVISGNSRYGVLISFGSSGNVVQGNFIGTDLTGTQRLSNIADGVNIIGASNNTIGGTTPGAANVIGGNVGDGIRIFTASGNVVQGNLIGIDLTGTQDLINGSSGVEIFGGSNNTIGGTTGGARNIISGNGSDGVLIDAHSAANLVQGNYFGIDKAGTGFFSNLNNGVEITLSSNNTIGGTEDGARNVIAGNGKDGVLINVGSSGNVVQGNFIGTDISGTKALANTDDGVAIFNASNNLIGGTVPGAGNVISGNLLDGILIQALSAANLVQGNLIGTDRTGTLTLPNLGNGLGLQFASNNTIGGTTPGAGNVIGGNNLNGVLIASLSTINLVAGNVIGTDLTGTQILTNLGDGVNINDATGNTIGGTTASARNIIAANGGDGVRITNSSTGNLVQGDYIGIEPSAIQHLANLGNGVEITLLSSGNTIGGTTGGARNIISRNAGMGVLIVFGSGNLLQGNYIGTDPSGTQSVGNRLGGVSIGGGASDNTIGGLIAAARNLIAGNSGDGISIAGTGQGADTVDNQVQGNYIGTNVSGTLPLGNLRNGIFILDAPNNLIGGSETGAGNLISGNGQDGVLINSKLATGDLVQGNLIGTDATGTVPLGNQGNGVALTGAPGNTIGGTAVGARNVIAGNIQNGIDLSNLQPMQGGVAFPAVLIVGNFIGTDLTGTRALGNAADGVLLDTAASNMIGGTTAAARNVISANGVAGVEIRGGNSISNLVQGNYIGTDASGKAALANLVGVFINGASNNTIGGTDPGAGNLISGNSNPQGSGVGVQILGFGATGNLVEGNLIGTDATGTLPRGNDTGVFINDVAGNTIGGTANGARNVISGNTSTGIQLLDQGAGNNVVEGNLIGTDINGTRTLLTSRPNLGILVNNTPGTDVIGGTTAAARNVISGFKVGIEIFAPQSQFNPTAGTAIEGNFIGTDQTGETVLGNDVGVFINGVPLNTIGGTTPGARNVISGNTVGIQLLGATATRNLIQGNFIGLGSDGKKPLGNHTGIFLDAASNNTIGGTTPGAGNVIAGNGVVNQEGSTGIYLFDGAANNTIEGNYIGTDASGRSSRDLAQGDYGVLLFNASNNPIARSLGTNRVVGSGIANLREFTGPVTQPRPSGGGKPGPHHPHRPAPAGPRKLLGFSRLARRPSRGRQPYLGQPEVTGGMARRALRPKRKLNRTSAS